VNAVSLPTRAEKSPQISLAPGPANPGTGTQCSPKGSRRYARPYSLLAVCAALLLAAVASTSPYQAAAPPDAVEGSLVVRTYSYGPSPAQRLDMHYRPGARARPWVLVIHGGSWSGGDKSGMLTAANAFSNAGFVVANVNYRLSGEAPWPAQWLDVANAIRWVKAHAAVFGINPHRGGAYGFSSGAQLAALLGTVGPGRNRIKAVISVAGVNDPYRGWRYSHEAGLARADGITYTPLMAYVAQRTSYLVRCRPDRTDVACWSRWRDIAPQNYASRDDARFLLYAAADDPAVPCSESSALHYFLRREGAPSTYVKVASGGHNQAILWRNAKRRQQALAYMVAATR
jgi:acetyl esterase/lipase